MSVKKNLIMSFILLLLIIPLIFLKIFYLRDNYFYDIFLGNYIFFIHYLVMILFILYFMDRFIEEVPKKMTIIIIILSFIVLGIVGRRNFENSKIIKKEIILNKKAHTDKLRIVFISDFHLSTTSKKSMFKKSFEKINPLKPDIVLIGGDILDYNHAQVKENYEELVKSLNVKYGIYGVLGNHEYYGGAIENEKYIESLGIDVLKDKRIKVLGVNIIGRDDSHNKSRKSLKDLVKGISKKEPIIVVDHNPKYIDETKSIHGDLHLSGHTHNGQFFPYNLIVNYIFENGHGYRKFENLHTVVTAGLGTWQIPYRIGTNGEINVIDIKFKTD